MFIRDVECKVKKEKRWKTICHIQIFSRKLYATKTVLVLIIAKNIYSYTIYLYNEKLRFYLRFLALILFARQSIIYFRAFDDFPIDIFARNQLWETWTKWKYCVFLIFVDKYILLINLLTFFYSLKKLHSIFRIDEGKISINKRLLLWLNMTIL